MTGETADATGWPTAFGTAGNTCFSTDSGPTDGTPNWTFSRDEFQPRAPCVADGTVYVVGAVGESGSEQMRVFALDVATGDLQWEQTVHDNSLPRRSSAPTVADGIVYVVTNDSYLDGLGLVALDAADGEILWELSGAAGNHYGGPVALNGRVHTITESPDEASALRAFEPDGSLAWENSPGDQALSAYGIAGGGNSLVVTDVTGVYGVDAADGETRWEIPADEFEERLQLPPAVAGNTAFVATGATSMTRGRTEPESTYRLYALDIANGAQRWRTSMSNDDEPAAPAGPLAVTDDAVFVVQAPITDGGRELVAYDRTSGTVQSRQSLRFVPNLASPTVAGGTPYVPADFGIVTDDGTLAESLELSAALQANWGVPVFDGQAAVVTNEGIALLQ
ncbi:outer membrane protein assembly factor BamB family protein [Halosegnis longus]|uniref:outer membrane protein assembly factor BamB family protein n=1 Tax=Halosegnis longus TaxID=2216012 RepID=UPI00156262F2|nr:PQQ-binding-like beta-propeller repeat protein [Halosegnis longus]